MKKKVYGPELSQRYATTFERLSKDGALSPIVGLDMVSSEQVAAYLSVTPKELLKARTKCKNDLDLLGVASMNGQAVAARVPGIERVDGSTYKAKLCNGQSVTIPAPLRVYYTAAGVARVKEELEMNMGNVLLDTQQTEGVATCQADENLQIFTNPEFGQIRTMRIDGEPWFVGKDVCEAFGDTNYRRSLKRLDEDEKGVSQINTPGGRQNMTIINEPGLYSLLFYMQPQKAKGVSQNNRTIEVRIEQLSRFKRWVTSEVLPSIRKHGVYMTPKTIESVLTDPDFIIRLATQLKEEQEKSKALAAKIEADRPKVDFADHISGYQGTISMGDFAKLLSKNGITIGRNKLYQWLRNEKILNQNNIPYQKYMDNGYFAVIETIKRGYPYQATRVTGAGQVFLQKRFAAACSVHRA